MDWINQKLPVQGLQTELYIQLNVSDWHYGRSWMCEHKSCLNFSNLKFNVWLRPPIRLAKINTVYKSTLSACTSKSSYCGGNGKCLLQELWQIIPSVILSANFIVHIITQVERLVTNLRILILCIGTNAGGENTISLLYRVDCWVLATSTF